MAPFSVQHEICLSIEMKFAIVAGLQLYFVQGLGGMHILGAGTMWGWWELEVNVPATRSRQHNMIFGCSNERSFHDDVGVQCISYGSGRISSWVGLYHATSLAVAENCRTPSMYSFFNAFLELVSFCRICYVYPVDILFRLRCVSASSCNIVGSEVLLERYSADCSMKTADKTIVFSRGRYSCSVVGSLALCCLEDLDIGKSPIWSRLKDASLVVHCGQPLTSSTLQY